MTTVVLSGSLALFAGRSSWQFVVSSVAEVLRAIDANVPNFLAYLASPEEGQTLFRVRINGQDCPEEGLAGLQMHRPLETVEFIPIPSGGAKAGLWLMVAGALLSVVGIGLPLLGVGVASAAASTALSLTAAMGLALVSAGLSQLIAPKATQPPDEKPENRPSYLFSGPVNSLRQGNPVPLGYGELIVGSQVISAGLTSTDISLVTIWNRLLTYVRNAEVMHSGIVWRAETSVPAGQIPSDTSTYWTRI